MSSRCGPSTRPYGRWRFPGGPDDCRFHRRALPAVSRLSQSLAKVEEQSAALKRPLALRDLVLTQLLYVVGSSWVGVAARLGESQSAFWLLAIVLFYLPQAAVVIYLTRRLPLEGGLYQWTKVGFGEFWGFLTAWNLWVYTLVLLAATSLAVSSTLAYAVGPRAAALAGTERFQLLVGVALIALMVTVAILGLRIGKWVHNFGGLAQLLAFAALIVAPLVAAARGVHVTYHPLGGGVPTISLFSANVLGKLGMGALSGFEWVAIMAGESRDPSRSISRSVFVATPIIAVMFILGTSAVFSLVQGTGIDLVAPIPQALRLAYGSSGVLGAVAPFLVMLLFVRAVANANLLFTGNTRLPMVAGWDGLLPAWFTTLHPRWRTPVNSIAFVAAITFAILLFGITGVGLQEAFQMLDTASGVLYALTYLAMFALPVLAARRLGSRPPRLLVVAAVSGFLMTLLYIVLSVVPIVGVVSRWAFGVRIVLTIGVANAIGAALYSVAARRRAKRAASAAGMDSA